MKATVVSSLSASGSANLPKSVTMFHLRARWPSRKSVKLAAAKMMPATRYQVGLKSSVPIWVRETKTMNTGTRMMRVRVSLLGRFI